ncbi:hypothetical protein TWF694_004591 [Orbilia ellipsospora]|uniref:carboxypeptidase C n=1 Tax=Orbilia ellipsospora TaxID=2528407 RepID=A0AAV9WVT2_9PEZI
MKSLFILSAFISALVVALPTNDLTDAQVSKRDFTRSKLPKGIVDTQSLGFDKVRQFSGFLNDDAKDKHLFYWFFESRSKPAEDPIIVWFSGGPGVASIIEAFDFGPAALDKNNKPKHKPLSWNNNANLMFIDQPTGAGFSFGKEVGNSVDASKDVVSLLSVFFKQFPEYSKQPVHFTGSSYAGHFVPVFAKEALSQKTINLKSISMGNGIMDPLSQYPSFIPMGCGQGGYPAIYTPERCKELKNLVWPACEKEIKTCYANPKDEGVCLSAFGACEMPLVQNIGMEEGVNVYDLRPNRPEKISELDESIERGMAYLNDPAIATAMGAEGHEFLLEGTLHPGFSLDHMVSVSPDIADILKQIPVLIYAGDADFICNWIGNKATAENIEWAGKSKFNKAEMKPWTVKGKEAGQIKSASGLTFLKVYDANHAVPRSQPEVAYEMMNSFLSGRLA